MGARYFWDTESDGLLDEATVIHSMILRDLDTGARFDYADGLEDPAKTVAKGIERLREADEVYAHNMIRHDEPLLDKLFPGWDAGGQRPIMLDTIVLARIRWPDIKQFDKAVVKKGMLPPRLQGRYSLEAFGHRMGNPKGEYKDGWATWTPAMHEYMIQDGDVGWDLVHKLYAEPDQLPEDAVTMEHDFARLMFLQERHGFPFDKAAATDLYATLAAEREELRQRLVEAVGCFYKPGKPFTPKQNNAKMGYTAGVPLTKAVLVEFNPDSGDHIANRLMKVYGWEPTEFTKTGKPEVKEETLDHLQEIPIVPDLLRYMMLSKRIGQIAEGDKAWLKLERNGRIHGRVEPNGANGGRCTHNSPNVTAVPTVDKPYGEECRECWTSMLGYLLVGCDADGIELRMLGHYLAPYDGGAFIKALLEGDKEKGTDPHSLNAIALGLDPKELYTVNGVQDSGRQIAKRFMYAFLYGAGAEKLGKIVGVTVEIAADLKARFGKYWSAARYQLKQAGRKLRGRTIATIVRGRVLKEQFLRKVPGLAQLKAALDAKIDATRKACGRAWIKGIDGRRNYVRSKHSVLNLLLQSAAGIAMKKAATILAKRLSGKGWSFGQLADRPGSYEWAMVAHVHDDLVSVVLPHLVQEYGTTAVDAIAAAGRHYDFRIPLDAQFKSGTTWKETH